MKKIQVLLSIFTAFSMDAVAEAPEKDETTINQAEAKINKEGEENQDPELVKAVEEALKAMKMESPLVHEDSLRVWKNFSSTSKPVNYTYRFWGRRLILWLKDEKKIAFQTEEQVGDVFKVLWRKGLISQNAVVVLMVDAWSHLVYLEGSPSWEKRMENRRPEGGTIPDASHKQIPKERSV